jgi:two-component system chemotaxis response regulator CheY
MRFEITVLIVDDSRIMRNTVKGALTVLNVSGVFFFFFNGEDALHILEEDRIDLVLLDWNMPKLSGIDFLKQVRADEKYKKLPIIMVTSESAKFNVIEAIKNGATDYVTKPVNLDVFKEKLAKLPLFRGY